MQNIQNKILRKIQKKNVKCQKQSLKKNMQSKNDRNAFQFCTEGKQTYKECGN